MSRHKITYEIFQACFMAYNPTHILKIHHCQLVFYSFSFKVKEAQRDGIWTASPRGWSSVPPVSFDSDNWTPLITQHVLVTPHHFRYETKTLLTKPVTIESADISFKYEKIMCQKVGSKDYILLNVEQSKRGLGLSYKE